jgi:hypothetical protein
MPPLGSKPRRAPGDAVFQPGWRGAEQNRALQMLAGSTLGCTEAIMPAHGFTVEILERLVLDGLATATPGTVHAGGRPIKVTWLTITDLGRQALAGA